VLLPAVLAGLFSLAGGYFGAGFQARHAVVQLQFAHRVQAYAAFLDKIDRSRAPAISQLLSVGAMGEFMVTDGEIQSFEDRVAALLESHDVQELFWQLNADANILRLHGSPRVAEICDDVLKAIVLRDDEINWTNYALDVAGFYAKWKSAQLQGVAYGWEERFSGDERLMIMTVAKLSQALIRQLRSEIQVAAS